MSTHNGHYARRWQVVGLSILAVVVILGGTVFRQLGEADRIRNANDVQDRRITANFTRIEQLLRKVETEARADCNFKLDFVRLPAEAARDTHRPPAPFLVRLAQHARTTFITKGCPTEIDPDTGRPFGPPPEVRTR